VTDSGQRFQQETRYTRGQLPTGRVAGAPMTAPYKEYPGFKRIVLPTPSTEGGMGLWQALRGRHSVRSFVPGQVTLAQLAQLLWACDGATRVLGPRTLRTAPSAGALYPIETYVVAHQVEGLTPGIYHYQVRTHELVQLAEGDYRSAVAAAALDQDMAGHADLVLLWSAVFGRTTAKYQQRGYRYVYLDAGHLAQNASLAAVALGLGSCQIAALYDGEADALLQLDGDTESVLYMTAIGRERRRGAVR
jgi:SagB-type dehydrogenase family enzyme